MPERTVYAFPSRSRCTRCGSLDNERVATKGEIQYRKCRVVTCRTRYRLHGKPV